MNFLLEVIKKVLYLIPIVLVLAFLFMLAKYTLKALNVSGSLSSISKRDYLPPPGTYSASYGKAPTPTDTPTNPTMEELNPWMKTGEYNYLGKTVDYTQANSQVRDIVIGNNNTIRAGITITGKARDVFLTGGKFIMLVLNESGQVIASTLAVSDPKSVGATWIPWQAKIGSLGPSPTGNCILVLQNQNITNNPQLTKIIRIPAACN